MLTFGNRMLAQTKFALIPYPHTVEEIDGVADFSKGYFLEGGDDMLAYLNKEISQFLHAKPNKTGVKIKLLLDKGFEGPTEGYQITVEPNTVLIRANARNGLFYAIQTLKQLGLQYGAKIPSVRIIDQPKFGWRAYMLDEGRYFQGKETVLKLLDEMALLKLNTFHWHLTDDGGWRIEIKKYPLLTKIGSKRDSLQTNHDGQKWDSNTFDGKEHAGYYTQEEIKEIVAYTKARNIQIIPEINMPGHASAAVASYAWLGTTKQQIKVPVKFGVVSTVFDVTDPEVIQFLHDVLGEVSALFPSSVIHIGGMR